MKVPSQVIEEITESDIIFTAETHNMPTAVAPFSGATTGTGGRIRDVQGVGRGGYTVAGTAGYSVGNLLIPGYYYLPMTKFFNLISSDRYKKSDLICCSTREQVMIYLGKKRAGNIQVILQGLCKLSLKRVMELQTMVTNLENLSSQV